MIWMEIIWLGWGYGYGLGDIDGVADMGRGGVADVDEGGRYGWGWWILHCFWNGGGTVFCQDPTWSVINTRYRLLKISAYT